MKTKCKVQTGGKVYLAGEYTILFPGQASILKYIPIHMTACIQISEEYRLSSDLFRHTATLYPDTSYALIQESIAAMNELLRHQGFPTKCFSLSITGEMGKRGKKYGIGSSGSIILLTIKAIASLYQLKLSRDQLFKLASYVLLNRGDNGSMGDLACISYQDLVYYQSFDRERIRKAIFDHSLSHVLSLDWGYVIEPIKPTIKFDFLVGWTKESSISSEMVKKIQSRIDSPFLLKTHHQVEILRDALMVGKKGGIIDSINKVSDLLKGLSDSIYHPKLIQLRESMEGLDGVAKSSGAGGGDCGIALSFNEVDSEILKGNWKIRGIELLYQERMGEDGTGA